MRCWNEYGHDILFFSPYDPDMFLTFHDFRPNIWGVCVVRRYMGTYFLKAIFCNFLFPSAFMSAGLVWVCAKRPRKGWVLVIFFPRRGCRGRDGPLFFEDGGCDSSAGSFPVALSEQAVPTFGFCPLTVLLSQSQETRSSRRGQEMTSCSPQ